MTDAATIAETILSQLGGNRFRAMTGARNFIYAELDGNVTLRFWLPGSLTRNRINRVAVRYNAGSDDYTMTFEKARKVRGLPTLKTVSESHGVYCDQLVPFFESATGLDTRF